jgi:uncharacterized protein YndB with AHSA1/START domain
MSAAHPMESLVTVDFAGQGGKTLLTLRHAVPRAVPEQGGIRGGWNEMFDRLDALAAHRR